MNFSIIRIVFESSTRRIVFRFIVLLLSKRCRRFRLEGRGGAEHRRRRGLCEIETLYEIDTQSGDGLEVGERLDPFGDAPTADTGGQEDDGLDGRSGVVILRTTVDEVAVDLEELRPDFDQHAMAR